jgi:hypothetical protein
LVPNRQLAFNDIDANDSYAPFINTLKNTEIIHGGDFVFSGTGNHSSGKQEAKFQTGEWQFQPERVVTRLEAVKVALISNCIPVDETIVKPKDGFEFKDLPVNENASDEAKNFAARVFYTAYRHGIVTGFQDGKAHPFDIASTPEILAITLRSANSIPQGYDTVGGAWYEKYVRFAKENGLLNGTEVKDASGDLKRKDFAKVLVRVMAYNPNPDIYGYIERVDVKNQKFDLAIPVQAPKPDMGAFEVKPLACPKVEPTSCLTHDAGRKLFFDDVATDDWSKPYIDILRTTKIVKDGDYIASGIGNHSTGRQQAKYKNGGWLYEPDRYSTRLELTKTALVANCIAVEDNVPVPTNGFRFTDLPVDVVPSDDLDFFAARVFYTAYKHGIITGKNSISARPFDDVSRVEAIAILTRASKDQSIKSQALPLPYIDTTDSAWYAPILSFAFENGIVGGQGDKTFKADRLVKRSEMAKLIYFFMLLNDNQGIRNYAQSLKAVYGLNDDAVPATPANPLTTAPVVGEQPLGKKANLRKAPVKKASS